jgi:hypothetical protein
VLLLADDGNAVVSDGIDADAEVDAEATDTRGVIFMVDIVFFTMCVVGRSVSDSDSDVTSERYDCDEDGDMVEGS